MLRNQTLFIVGAGASYEVGLPLGPVLADKIAAKLHFEFEYGGFKKGDYDLFSAFQQKFRDNEVLNSHLKACRRIRDGIQLARSIDNYIDTHRDDHEVELCGKIAIIDCIATSEKGSKLYFEPRSSKFGFDTGKLANTWHFEFVNLLFDGVPKSRISSVFEDIGIICFNYDRCIQQALLLALHTLYHLDIETCHDLVDELRIVYPYGSLGPLPRQKRPNAINFGEEIYKPRLFELSEGIRTYSEQVADEKSKSNIAFLVDDAETVVFLGCAYHPQNTKLLSAVDIELLRRMEKELPRKIFGTAIGISKDGIERVSERLAECFAISPSSLARNTPASLDFPESQIALHRDLSCFELLQYYRQSLQMQ